MGARAENATDLRSLTLFPSCLCSCPCPYPYPNPMTRCRCRCHQYREQKHACWALTAICSTLSSPARSVQRTARTARRAARRAKAVRRLMTRATMCGRSSIALKRGGAGKPEREFQWPFVGGAMCWRSSQQEKPSSRSMACRPADEWKGRAGSIEEWKSDEDEE